MIDCGVSLKRIRQALDFDMSKIKACLVSHTHGDHASYLSNLEKETPIQIWCSNAVKNDYDLKTSKDINAGQVFKPCPEFWVHVIELKHDVKCFGFVVETDTEVLFYATDTGSLEGVYIPGLTHLMIEANHSFEALIESGHNKYLVKRIAETHLDIDQAIDFAVNHLDSLQEIYLIHLSDYHGQEKEFKKLMAGATGLPVYIAK